jgi:23S rRNA (guanosine2251-2'-O)-methyltransferase
MAKRKPGRIGGTYPPRGENRRNPLPPPSGAAPPGPANPRPENPRPARRQRRRKPAHERHPDVIWLFGVHPVLAALANPTRPCRRLLLTEEVARALGHRLGAALAAGNKAPMAREIVARGEIDRLLPPATVHQGIALEAGPLPDVELDAICRGVADQDRALLLLLDQVTDPQNVGAVLRAAAGFGALAVVVTERHAPAATASLAKAASGALERVPLVRVTNLVRAMEELKGADFWCAGLDADAPQSLTEAKLAGRTALVLGAEGEGLRRLTRETCDMLLRIPMALEGGASLNVAAAAAIALYEYARGG